MALVMPIKMGARLGPNEDVFLGSRPKPKARKMAPKQTVVSSVTLTSSNVRKFEYRTNGVQSC